MYDLRGLSFGGTAALVTSMGLITGLDAATASTGTVICSLLIAGLADNLTDALSVHIYQESERLPEREAFWTTVKNFLVRLCISLSFVSILLLVPVSAAIPLSIVWGFILLSGLSYSLARAREVSAIAEMSKHAAVAVAVIIMSKAIGAWALTITTLI